MAADALRGLPHDGRRVGDLAEDPVTEGFDRGPLLVALLANKKVGTPRQRDLGSERDDEAAKADITRGNQFVGKHHAGAFAGSVECMIGDIEAQPTRGVDASDARHLEPVGPGGHHARQIDLDQGKVHEVLGRTQGMRAVKQLRAA